MRAGDLLSEVLPDVALVPEPDVDEEDILMAGPLLEGFE